MHFLSSEESSIVVAFTLHPSGSVKQTMNGEDTERYVAQQYGYCGCILPIPSQ